MPRDVVSHASLADPSWNIGEITGLTEGLNTTDPIYDINDEEWADCKNLVPRDGKAVLDTGYKTLCYDPWTTPLTQQVVRGNPRLIAEHISVSDVKTQILITNETTYRIANGANGDYWELISGGSGATTLNGAATGTVFNVVDATGIAVGDIIGVTDDNGDVFTTKVTIKNVNQLTVDVGLPASVVFSGGNAVIRGVRGKLTGTDDEQVDYAFVPGNFWLVVTNNVDPVIRYDGTTMDTLAGLSTINVTKAKCLNFYSNLLFIGNIEEAGNRLPNALRWCDAGNPIVWNAGIAGFENLYDSRDPIVSIKNLGDEAIIYKSRSIIRQEFIGTASQLFNFRLMVPGVSHIGKSVGPMSVHSVVALPNVHYIHSINGIFAYQGGFNVTEIGQKIFRKVHDVRGHLDRAFAGRAYSFVSQGRNEAFFIYPKSGESYGTQAIVLNLESGYLGHRQFAHNICGVGVRQGTPELLISDLIGLASEQEWSADSLASSETNPTILLCSTGKVTWEYDYVTPTDGGTPIAYELITKQFRGDGYYVRFDAHEFLITGTDMSVYYSVDGGNSWTLMKVISSGGGEAMIRLVPDQFVSPSVVYKFAGSGGGATISRILANTRAESKWGA